MEKLRSAKLRADFSLPIEEAVCPPLRGPPLRDARAQFKVRYV